MNTWSRESIHRPPMPPVTQRFGNGLGQEGSTSNLGGLPCACIGAKHQNASAMAKPADTAAIRTKLVFFFIASLLWTWKPRRFTQNSRIFVSYCRNQPRRVQ